MFAKTINFIVIFLLITGIVVWILAAFEPFKQEAFIEDTIKKIEVYDAQATEVSETITDIDRVKNILECINTCKREEMSPEASYSALDVTLILYGEEDNYEVGVWQGGSTVSFVYDATIIDSELEPFPL
ncbi:hypothetical protein [Terribacillus saccharophilus]|uniref:hypothetical protein n=1 Tax=Terribacillus saccharophilus TaxID=361277 RepID=UPI002DC841EC|nr:hypothetical protein [Terribacillus saccharophilus]